MIKALTDLAPRAQYSLLEELTPDPQSRKDGVDHEPREVFSGHFVPVNPKPLEAPEYIFHSKPLFRELGFDDALAENPEFMRMFSGDLSQLPLPLKKQGWACGYALSIFGTEYYQQCPFQTGNGYGDGRAISIFEGLLGGRRWEMQLKGGGPTPYCRGADGRAVLRSSVREFLAQEHMHALGVPTSRSLSLYVSLKEKVRRPWFSAGSTSREPDIYVLDPAAITTRVASSFIRVGQLELFGRRARKNEHAKAGEELEKIVSHLIAREYPELLSGEITAQVNPLAQSFLDRLTSLVANWIRVGYCQGNFNSDNCAAGGFTLDYGPFGFCEAYHPNFQPWTGGGQHFAFMNQPLAAERNFGMFCLALTPLLASQPEALRELDSIRQSFPLVMQKKLATMWSEKLGLKALDVELFRELELLMRQTPVDYTIFFRELSQVPESIEPLTKSFYRPVEAHERERWSKWFASWMALVTQGGSREEISASMKAVNPKYSLREWFLVPAYQQAAIGNYELVRELAEVMNAPYAEQSKVIEEKYYRLRPVELFDRAGVSHMSCSS